MIKKFYEEFWIITQTKLILNKNPIQSFFIPDIIEIIKST